MQYASTVGNMPKFALYILDLLNFQECNHTGRVEIKLAQRLTAFSPSPSPKNGGDPKNFGQWPLKIVFFFNPAALMKYREEQVMSPKE